MPALYIGMTVHVAVNLSENSSMFNFNIHPNFFLYLFLEIRNGFYFIKTKLMPILLLAVKSISFRL